MKESIIKPLSKAILSNLDLKEVIYAEATAPGGMGNSGGIIIYTIEKDTDQSVCYETNIDTDEELYVLAQDFLILHTDMGKVDDEMKDLHFEYFYGGMGNSVFINKTVKLEIIENYFLHKSEQGNYKIIASCTGVFQNVAGQMREKNK